MKSATDYLWFSTEKHREFVNITDLVARDPSTQDDAHMSQKQHDTSKDYRRYMSSWPASNSVKHAVHRNVTLLNECPDLSILATEAKLLSLGQRATIEYLYPV